MKEAGRWTDKAQANQDKLLQRQAVLADAWKAYKASPADDFAKGWMDARASALTDAGFETIFNTW